MKYGKRVSAFVLALLMLLALMAGCSQGESTATDPPEDTQAAATEAPAEETQAPDEGTEAPADETEAPSEGTGNVSLPLTEETTYFTIQKTVNAAQVQYLETRTNHPVVLKFGEMTGVYLEFSDVSSQNGADQFNVMIAGGDYPDYIGDINTFYTAGIDDAIAQEIIIDLTPYADTLAANYTTAMELYSNPKVYYTDEGTLGAFYTINTAGTMLDQGLIIRQDWLDEVGMEVPTTFDELHDVLSAFVTELGITGGPFFTCNLANWSGNALGDAWNIATLYKPGTGAHPYSVNDGTVVLGWTAPEYRECLELIAQWWKEGLIWRDFATGNAAVMISANPLAMEAVTTGTLGVFWGEMSDIETLPSQYDIQVSAMPTPVLEEGQTLHISQSRNDVGVTGGIAVSTACADPELAIEYMNFWYTEDAAFISSWGFEGVTYDSVDENGTPIFNDFVVNNPDNIPFKIQLAVACMEDTFGGLFYGERNRQGYSDVALAASDIWASNRDGAYKWPSAVTMSADESSEFARMFSDIETYATESCSRFMTGEIELNDNTWNEYLNTMESMGASECVALLQAAYDRYLQR